LFGFPETASGLFVDRHFHGKPDQRADCPHRRIRCQCAPKRDASRQRLSAYTSTSAHISNCPCDGCAGIGSGALRMIPVNYRHQMDVAVLESAIAADGWRA